MGTTADNIWVRAEDAQRVAEAFGTAALVAPPSAGWVTVYPAQPGFGDPSAAQALSTALRVTCVDFFCFDSDIVQAALVVGGEVVDTIGIGPPGYGEDLEEMGDEAPAGDPVPGIAVGWEVTGDLDRWTAALGGPTPGDLIAAVNAAGSTPFAEEVACALFGAFAMASDRLVMAHRYFDEAPDAAADFIRFSG